MANPFGQYTGQRVQALPPGYLAAYGQMATNLQRGLAGAGEQIGAGIAKYYENKEEEKNVASIGEFSKLVAQHTALVKGPEDESGVGPVQPEVNFMQIYGQWAEANPDVDRKTQEAVYDRAMKMNDAASTHRLNKAKEAYYSKQPAGAAPGTFTLKMNQIAKEQAAFEESGKEPEPGEFGYGSPAYWRRERELIRRGEMSGASKPSAMRDSFSLVDEIGGALNWDAKTIATRKNELLAKFPTKDAPPDKLQQLEAIQDTPWYKSAKPEQQAIWDRRFHAIEDPPQTKTTDQQNWAKIEPDLLKRLEEDPTYGNKEFAAQYDEFWGLTPPAGTTSDLEIKLNRLDGMDLSPEERKQAVLEAMNARVAPIKPTAKMQDYEYFIKKLDPALHDRFTRETAGLTPTEVDLKKDVVTWLTGTGIAEGDAVRMSMGRDISSVTKAQQHIALLKSIEEKFELGELTREEADMQAFMTNEFAGIPTAGDLKSQRLSNELKQKELEKEAKLLEALQDPNSKPEMMDTPLPNYKYMRKPPSTNWTLVNISQGGAKITRQVSKAMADQLNLDLEKQNSQYRWQFDATDPRTGGTYMYKPLGAYGDIFKQPPAYKPGERFVPPMELPPIPSPAAKPPGAAVIPLDRFTPEVIGNVNKLEMNTLFEIGGKRYRKVEGGVIEVEK